jgi:ABC-type lipoprotein export system ATPase subunit
MICSDNHNAAYYELKTNLWLRADPTFRGLLMVLREPQSRVYVGDCPPELSRIERNKTKYIQKLEYERKATAPATQNWFNGEVCFNPGLVAIVGNKGSGKSALADTIGHLGGSDNTDSFSFLCKRRFQHPRSGLASHFAATLEWWSGERLTRSLNENPTPEEVERVKYLPQDHVETVCNELAGIGERTFENELKAVIFSHVPESSRLGQTTLDDLVNFQTSEKQKRIDSLLKQLREQSRIRASLERQSSPENKRKIEEKIRQVELEIEVHEKAKPEEVANPSAEGVAAADPGLFAELTAAEEQKGQLEQRIEEAKKRLKIAERRQAVAKKLKEKLSNFEKDFKTFQETLKEEAAELGINHEELASLTINAQSVEGVLATANNDAEQSNDLIDEDKPESPAAELTKVSTELVAIQTRLDAPNRIYQAYLKEFGEWQRKKEGLIGTAEEPDSLEGLKSALAAFDDFAERIKVVREEQLKVATEIHEEKVEQARIFRDLYAPVQHFIDNHALAKDKLMLEFRAELTDEDFSDRLLSHLTLNRKGSFMGIEEGRARVLGFTQLVEWEEAQSVRDFLTSIDNALHKDLRETPPPTVQLQDQLAKGKKMEEVFDLLYGLEFVVPRYVLRWEGKDLSMLSPGERGTLLLVFYLLIDKGEVPLIIDQPEGNLDNHTVTKVLVDCIKETRKKRQVFIVTHNPNLAVVCDADQVVHASMDKSDGNKITYTSGALENPLMSNFVTDVLEGTRWAFDVRGSKYEVGKTNK